MAKNTSGGNLYERVAFDRREQVNPDSPADLGNTESDFVEQFTRRAGFVYLRGTETVIAARLEGRQPIVVRVRKDSQTSTIATDWRMRDARDGKEFAVKSIAETPDRRFLDIIVEAGVAP